jgi:SNF2 family DNA or RNA helicase
VIVGSLTYAPPSDWILKAQPHVMVRAKRVFAQLGAQYASQLVLSDTLEVCRDLAWFRERYPLEMTPADLERLEGQAIEHCKREEVIADVLSGDFVPRPFELALPPRDYQRVAADLALRMGALLIADDVGLGKTIEGICVLSEPATRPALIVTLTHLAKQWERELAKFAPGLRQHTLKHASVYPIRGGIPDVIITTYSKLAGWAEHLAGKVRTVIFDEVQELRRGEKSDKGKAAYQIADAADFKVGLSATPIYNYGGEIYNVLRALAPAALGTWSEFQIEWCGAADAKGRAQLKDAKAFGTYLRSSGLMLRRTREDVGRELPEVIRISHEVETDEAPLKNITSAAEALARIILEKNESRRGEKMQAAEELNSIVRHATGVAKAPYVAEFVRILVANGERVVLFGWHHDVYSVWKERLSHYAPAMYTGAETPSQKEKERHRFLSGETPVLIMSLRSGAGLDGLQGVCHTVVFGELDWSPGCHEQCIGRVHRDGQGGSVVVYYLLATVGSDPVVADVLGVKRAQVEGLRNPQLDIIEKLDVSGDRIRELARRYLDGARP